MNLLDIRVNLYDEDTSNGINVVDSGVVFLEESDIERLVDLALEIGQRHRDGKDVSAFVQRIAEVALEIGAID